ncbi:MULTISPECIES: suppressor of fused domain protein [unclassified Paenibacillus]|uniref:suppressor of fused domain protein n=1 Tax=unclassified Paenibacillus TaxID=185978 RepID=UPI002406A14B|nr:MULTISPECIES: suppressor of fused domain protein [unclassified Paenibacillus]MDF9843152.1 suppressor of fused-like protein [Paenibacillus sp. PastF-2]MDF9849636.1 suppressor of fused-like protein [Paenibacillus sp. PastM-2]MDF9856447.1 suppressor of fused-like protein [Paenibacillus sp. PastF-1]MDH6481718.1 suppressor of fused-like protein [Paenibacillus sp. PastH-2]MDH6508999.1 suppressor of fused-like protein [Paenibacillus sp. PastM-3]
MSEEEVEATGWDAIDEQMNRLYGEQEPKHYGALIPYSLGGKDPLQGISAYKAEKPYPHWHFVTYGFSELYAKESSDPEYSGYGFELTFRLIRNADEEEPPAWALNLLQNMARYVFSSGNIFASGHYLDANGPICLEADTKLTALAFTDDSELPAIDTPNGRVEFLQMVGITADELEAMTTWNTNAFLHAAQEELPYYITDLLRDSLLNVPGIRNALREGIERDGSSTGFFYVDQLEWEPGKSRLFGKAPAVLTMGAKQTEMVARLLSARLSKGKELALVSQKLRIILQPAAETAFEESEQTVRVSLSEATARELSATLLPLEGEYKLSSAKGLILRVNKTYIKDQDGQVVDTIG